MSEKITHELLKSWEPCADGYRRFCKLFPDGADLQTAMDGLIKDGHDDWSYWLFDNCKLRGLFISIVSRGYRNSGNRNSGNRNSGYWNSGNRNSGNRNSGNRNSGYWNSGNRNSGYWNSGNRNSGNRNSGNRNSGYWNSGNRNSGDWNSGFLNSKTPNEILVFNKLCNRADWDKAKKPDFLFFELTELVEEADMTEDEKQEHPHCSFTGGFLKTKNYKQAWKDSWDNADKENRKLVLNLPNFDAEIFYEITGIKVEG